VIATIGYFGNTAREILAAGADAATKGAQAGEIKQSAYTNGDAAHLVFTNLNPFTVETCVLGVVAKKGGGAQVKSVPVCTGEMKPRTTVVLEAPYPVGAVKDLCSGEPDRFGLRSLDWDRCTFDLAPAR
jgi:hypothetical protein